MNADSIFKLIGFNEVSSGLLVLTHSTKIDILQYVAFECFVASNECYIIENIWHRVFDKGLTVTSVVQVRQKHRGNEDETVKLIESKYGKSLVNIPAESVVDSKRVLGMSEKQNILSSQSSTDQYRNKLENYLEKAKQLSDFEDIPFIDEGIVKENDYTPMNMDEQIMASLQLVEGKNISPVDNDSSTHGLKPSQEWSFVREGLERNFGKQYFEGIRKDILEKESEIKPHFPKEGKYVKVYATKPLDHQYVNADEVGRAKKAGEFAAHQQALANSQMHSESKDSDYGTVSSAYFPPVIDDSHSQSMRSRGVPMNRQVTDTVITKSTGSYHQNAAHRSTKTEPILRRQPVEQNIQSPYFASQYYPETAGFRNTGISNIRNENIEKYQKRISAPLISREKMDPTQFLPVVTNAPILSGARSVSEVLRSNTTDGVQLHGAKTVHNVQQQNIPVQSNVLPGYSPWSCPHCTYLNTQPSDVCDMCSKSRDPNVESDSPPCAGYSSRVCDQCTLENEKDSVNCHACGHMLRGTQTVV